MGTIRSLQGLKGMLKGVQRELSDRQAAIKEEKETPKDDEREGIQQELK